MRNLSLKYLKHFLIFLFVIFLFESCEKEDEINDLTNKVKFSDFVVSEISYKTTQISSKIPENYGLDIEEFGHCWSLDSLPDINDSISVFTEYTSEAFVTELSGLNHNSKYYVRAYFKFGDNISYSDQMTFKTLEIKTPTVTTKDYTNLRAKSINCGGEVLSNNGGEILSKGICWNKTGNPTIEDSISVDSLGLGTFVSYLNNLEIDTKYYLRAYAINEVGAGYGNEVSFTTHDGIPDIEIIQIFDITANYADINVNLIDDGGLEVIENGICWNTSGEPTLNDTSTFIFTSNSVLTSGIENFIYGLESLEINTIYYVRGYVKNELGVHYGDEETFTTKDGIPVLNTINTYNITTTSAKSGGENISDEEFEIIEKGLCWSNSSNPTINDFKTINGSGSGDFESTLINLDYGLTYYLRAYATNENGTGYGDEIVLTMEWGTIQVQDYDGNWYNTVEIGDQVWLKENLKTTHYANGEELIDGSDITTTIDISYDYITKYWFINTYPDGDEAFKETYGLLYTWAAAMNGSSSSDLRPSGIQGACPDGWHVPSDNEWSDLAANYGGGIMNVGGPLKEIGYEHWDEPNAGATNESGFTALPAGTRHGNSYGPAGGNAYFWTSTEYNNDSTMYRACTNAFASLYHQPERKSSGFSVRCIKD